MRRRALLCAAVLAATPAAATPNGAAWSYDGGPGRSDCAECHFDSAPRRQDAALVLHGLPESIAPGRAYDLTLRLSAKGTRKAGFLLRAEFEDVEAGRFEPLEEGLEAKGGALRSTAPAPPNADGEIVWRFRWIAPDDVGARALFYVAANAANDDQSPFGDQIFLSVFEAPGAAN